ncbi:twitching motility protein PilT [Blautia marasmi]|uniref:twitching motility protein PilT n=1 Tax=Blautia marasmi TaxID=1917868 RepID=UPI00266D0D20|nr:twitching motility protein PilT [Blautia marasmi]
MVQLIVGEKGKGKTKILLDKANAEVRNANGSVVYLDKSTKHMYELNNKIRLIDVMEYGIENSDEFVGFIRGIVSQDHDLEQMYLDGFLKISRLENSPENISKVMVSLEKIAERYNVSFIISLSKDEKDLPEDVRHMIVTSL